MKTTSLLKTLASVAFFSATLIGAAQVSAQEKVELWPGLAPGETVREPNIENPAGSARRVTTPYLLIFQPEKKTSDVCVLTIPGGGFNTCFYGEEGIPNAKFWNSKGYVSAVLVYRAPRPASGPIYAPALQDARRAIRYLRANASKLGVDPNKIGAQGYSAGACLTLLAATNSETEVYEPVDELDKTPANLNFAIPIYPAYVLTDGATDPNANKGEGAKILSDFHFDAKTPPMCLVHGDADIYSPLGSVEVYKKSRKLGIPCELHIYAGAPHGFMFWNDKPNAADWQERCAAWLKKIGF